MYSDIVGTVVVGDADEDEQTAVDRADVHPSVHGYATRTGRAARPRASTTV